MLRCTCRGKEAAVAFDVKDSIDIEATVDEIMDVASDFESYPDWNSEVKSVEVLERDGDGRPTQVAWKVDAKIKTVGYVLEYDYSDLPAGYSWQLVEGDVKHLTGAYSFDEFDDVTDVGYELTLDPGFPVPGLLRRQGERRLKEAALDGLKERVESR
jgi:uncharacterized membrane protein